MRRLKMLSNVSLLGLLVSSSACASHQTDTPLFKCEASYPSSLEVLIVNINNHLQLSEFNLRDNSIEESITLKDFKLDHYHRALVDEKSLEFSIGERVILVSEYFSEEFNGVQRTLSVTFRQSGQTEYFECEEGSISNLALLFKESTE
ncbi:hypothetical protein ACSTK1_00715 [Vibrio parahaemolyticus]|uniref:hypothetical protein n=1 Tax=Vibrio parahaemolyticus TaxID=670 RepID=UPI00099834E6|nr:hypothetical protein [Vibrio parahaemolyticus]EGQ8002633.1 hypothetical protein [Vibrio parahaemolyticus]EGQ8007023.1 hypothetical protein [Vibrio parahaemolyticus]EHK2922425.1 hypothetical protein [Vibrio parahaemolyticus]EIV8499469.1 hypothetical protein [Vibrio parahaemolyticus]EIV8502470.1 hypothetical protein [Vibrio parahaemolyticus]